MKQLTSLLADIDNIPNKNIEDLTVDSICTDSRKVSPGCLFVAVKGLSVDGHDFIVEAADKGCVAIVAIKGWCASVHNPVLPPVIEVKDSSQALGKLAAAFYDYPGKELSLIGLTGTNGKTTTTYLLESIISEAGAVPGVIGTINYRYKGKQIKADFTTPEPIQLQKLLREMADNGVTHVVMEASSHALVLNRLLGLQFDVALFTNLSRDHLDFHENMEEYYQAKKMLFTQYLHSNGSAVVVADDDFSKDAEHKNHKPLQKTEDTSWSGRLTRELKEFNADRNGKSNVRIITCGEKDFHTIRCQKYEYDVYKTKAEISLDERIITIQSNLVGEFNLKNILGAVGVSYAMGIVPKMIGRGINRMGRVPGRMERVEVENKEPDFSVYIDYAHTPDAMENVLKNLRKIAEKRLLIVFGCGGDRDHGKRFLMGEVAGNYADLAIITADNSRTESTEKIIAEIQKGVETTGKKKLVHEMQAVSGYIVEPSRSKAIQCAIVHAEKGDIVLISGKGHETCQITREGTFHFDDYQEAQKFMAA